MLTLIVMQLILSAGDVFSYLICTVFQFICRPVYWTKAAGDHLTRLESPAWSSISPFHIGSLVRHFNLKLHLLPNHHMDVIQHLSDGDRWFCSYKHTNKWLIQSNTIQLTTFSSKYRAASRADGSYDATYPLLTIWSHGIYVPGCTFLARHQIIRINNYILLQFPKETNTRGSKTTFLKHILLLFTQMYRVLINKE